jgi:hypothetical protein
VCECPYAPWFADPRAGARLVHPSQTGHHHRGRLPDIAGLAPPRPVVQRYTRVSNRFVLVHRRRQQTRALPGRSGRRDNFTVLGAKPRPGPRLSTGRGRARWPAGRRHRIRPVADAIRRDRGCHWSSVLIDGNQHAIAGIIARGVRFPPDAQRAADGDLFGTYRRPRQDQVRDLCVEAALSRVKMRRGAFPRLS